MVFNQETYMEILDNLYDGIYLVDLDKKIFYWNKAAERISGFTASEVMGKSCSDNILAHIDSTGNSLCTCAGFCPLARTLKDGKMREVEAFLHHKDGYRLPVSIRVSCLRDAAGKIIGGVEIFSEINRYKSIELKVKDLEQMALLDNLTRTANRNYIEKEISIRFEEQKRFGVSFGILFIDIDFFKKINDTYGHDIGDQVLKFVAETMVKNSRPFDLVGRWGGEEFIIIARNVTPEYLQDFGNRLRNLIENSYVMVDNKKLQVSVSIGATLVRDNDTQDTLLKRADVLLYTSKQSGRNRLTIG